MGRPACQSAPLLCPSDLIQHQPTNQSAKYEVVERVPGDMPIELKVACIASISLQAFGTLCDRVERHTLVEVLCCIAGVHCGS